MLLVQRDRWIVPQVLLLIDPCVFAAVIEAIVAKDLFERLHRFDYMVECLAVLDALAAVIAGIWLFELALAFAALTDHPIIIRRLLNGRCCRQRAFIPFAKAFAIWTCEGDRFCHGQKFQHCAP